MQSGGPVKHYRAASPYFHTNDTQDHERNNFSIHLPSTAGTGNATYTHRNMGKLFSPRSSILDEDWAISKVKLIEWNLLHFRQKCVIRLFFV
jgi:hypothetical protein